MPNQLIEFAYLASAICFILALKGLSSPREAKMGNVICALGITLALIATFSLPEISRKIPTLIAIAIGGLVGVIIAIRLPMTFLPQLVAGFHSFVGLAAMLVAYSVMLAPGSFNIELQSGAPPMRMLIETAIGSSIGALTFTSSIVAFGKLQGFIKSAPIKFHYQHYFCIIIAVALLALATLFVLEPNWILFNLFIFLSMLLGVLLIIAVGGADMPIIVSMLNSYSGWATSGIGFTLSNNLLIITGAIVGSSGAILSYIMCKAVNRSLFNVVFGAFLDNSGNAAEEIAGDKQVKISSPEDAAYILKNASSVIIVPGYGMAVAQSQHAIKELVDILEQSQVQVRFAIHPVAGRMPGHMNVLLAESNIDYEKVLELEEINRDFASTDVVLVIGANDITNPAAKTNPQSSIYGMRILEVEKAKTILFIKRSMAAGYANIDNELFYKDNSFMLFGDAKKVVEEIIKYLHE
jgi:H+-translocating NAD(P) transhydrogenase subunit beta